MAYFEWILTDFGQLSADFSPFLGRGEALGGPKWVNWWPRPSRGPNSRNTGPISKILTVLEMAWVARQTHAIKGLKNAVKAFAQKIATRQNWTEHGVMHIQTSGSARGSKLASFQLDISSSRAFRGKKLILQFPAYFFGKALSHYAQSLWLKFKVWPNKCW